MMKKGPIKVMKIIESSAVGQNRIEIGIQATGGIGRRISTIGNAVSKDARCIAMKSPIGTPMICASRNPAVMRRTLSAQPSQY